MGIPCPRGDTDCHQSLHEPQRGTVLDPLIGSLRISDEYVYEFASENPEFFANKT